jgi:hypothetical protein
MDSNDIINQITLNCLISKTQLMKINNSKIKKNLNTERNAKIEKYKTHLIKLFNDLLEKNEESNLLDDDIKSTYIQFIDKSIIHLDKHSDSEIIICNEETPNNKMDDMINICYNERQEDLTNLEDENENENENEEYDDDENDEDEEY